MKINWESGLDFTDIKYEKGLGDAKGIIKITTKHRILIYG